MDITLNVVIQNTLIKGNKSVFATGFNTTNGAFSEVGEPQRQLMQLKLNNVAIIGNEIGVPFGDVSAGFMVNVTLDADNIIVGKNKGGSGGAVFINSVGSIKDSLFFNNVNAAVTLAVVSGSQLESLENTAFIKNQGGFVGGAILVGDDTPFTVISSIGTIGRATGEYLVGARSNN